MVILSVGSMAAASSGAAVAALVFTCMLLGKSVRDYSRSGPLLPAETLRHFRVDALKTLSRLGLAAFLVMLYLGLCGVAVLASIAILLHFQPGFAMGFITGACTIFLATGLQFARCLVVNPGVIVASSHYRITRFYPLWRRLTPGLVRQTPPVLLIIFSGLAAIAVTWQVAGGAADIGVALALSAVALIAIGLLASYAPEPNAPIRRTKNSSRPNILMLGCDTLRTDRVGAKRGGKPLTPHLDALASRGTRFENCYVPCGRTAPSLASILTGTWPQTHGIRDNFTANTTLNTPTLPKILAEGGYRTVAASDWCGADLGKFDFGFQVCDLPEDSWNVRHLIRQGPKDLRLFLSLFTRNRLGKRFLPELYYLGGVPSTDLLGRDVRAHLSKLAKSEQPFLLNAFFSTTHPPFASEYPYYTLFADADYEGPSKFAMARLTDPVEIIRRQGEPRKEFDLDQILALYDGCVKRFDDEVGRIISHLEACGLADNTVIVLYSDHGMEFFEHDTWGQGNSVVGEQSARVPLIIADPRTPLMNCVPEIVRSVDLAPTLLELTGFTVPEEMQGVSLASSLGGASPPNLAAYNESGIWLTTVPGQSHDHLRYPDLLELLDVPDLATGTLAIKPEYQDIVVNAKDRMIRLGNWKLTYHPLEKGERLSLFNLANDPACRFDVSRSHPDVVDNLRSLLQPWLAE